jgi:hypothetical protein
VNAFVTCSWRGILKIKWTERITNYEIYLISNFCRVLNIVCIRLGISPASNLCKPTFRNPVSIPSSRAGCEVWAVKGCTVFIPVPGFQLELVDQWGAGSGWFRVRVGSGSGRYKRMRVRLHSGYCVWFVCPVAF